MMKSDTSTNDSYSEVSKVPVSFCTGDLPFKSGFLTIGILGPTGQGRLRGIVLVHNLARSFAVEIAEFLVQQNTITGFLFECLEIISGNLIGDISKNENAWQSENQLTWIRRICQKQSRCHCTDTRIQTFATLLDGIPHQNALYALVDAEKYRSCPAKWQCLPSLGL